MSDAWGERGRSAAPARYTVTSELEREASETTRLRASSLITSASSSRERLRAGSFMLSLRVCGVGAPVRGDAHGNTALTLTAVAGFMGHLDDIGECAASTSWRRTEAYGKVSGKTGGCTEICGNRPLPAGRRS
jgi:hypothetical protein